MSRKGCFVRIAAIIPSRLCTALRLVLVLLVSMTVLLSAWAAFAFVDPHPPAVIVEDVSGRAWIRGPSGAVRAGVLSGLKVLDTLVVETGGATIVDLRTGARSTLGARSRLPIVETVARPEPGFVERFQQLLHDFDIHGNRTRKTGGVRGDGVLTPDGESVSAPALKVLCWTGVPGVRFVAVANARGDSIMVPFSAPAGSGAWDWPSAVPRMPGVARWHLLAARDERLVSAQMIVLTNAGAESLRVRYLAEAARRAPAPERQLMARLLAAIDGYRLW